MANPFAVLAVISSVGKAYATYQAGMAQKAYYDSQADVAKLQYKSKEIEAKEAGVEVLKQTNYAFASTRSINLVGNALFKNAAKYVDVVT